MLNNDIFISRLELIMEKNQLSACSFCRTNRCSTIISFHIFQNEINQALDFILKIYNSFNEVTLDWLLSEEPSKAIKPLAYLGEIGKMH